MMLCEARASDTAFEGFTPFFRGTQLATRDIDQFELVHKTFVAPGALDLP